MAYVTLFTSGEEFTFVADTFSNEQGYYQFTGMAAGTYEAHIYAYDYEYIGPGDTPGNAYEIPGGLRVALGDTTVADAYLDPEAIVTGQVTISVGATPLAGVLISAEGTDGVLLYAVTDVGGNYAVRNLFTGTFTLSAHKPGWEFADQNGIAVTQGQTTSGTVYESDGKTPIPGAVVFNFTTGCHRNSVHGTLGVSASQ